MVKKLFLFLINIYKVYISPMKKCPSCIYIPTCSEYAYKAISKYGILKGSCLSVYRIIRCNPFSKGGYDPVP